MPFVAASMLEVGGQAFSWAPDGARRIFAIDRRRLLVRAIDVPPVDVVDKSTALTFR
jgi:hypothetical protein